MSVLEEKAETAAPEAALSDAEVERRMRRMSRRSLLWGGVSAAAGFAGWNWLTTRPQEGGAGRPFRRALEFNERLARGYFRPARLSPTFARSRAEEPRP